MVNVASIPSRGALSGGRGGGRRVDLRRIVRARPEAPQSVREVRSGKVSVRAVVVLAVTVVQVCVEGPRGVIRGVYEVSIKSDPNHEGRALEISVPKQVICLVPASPLPVAVQESVRIVSDPTVFPLSPALAGLEEARRRSPVVIVPRRGDEAHTSIVTNVSRISLHAVEGGGGV